MLRLTNWNLQVAKHVELVNVPETSPDMVLNSFTQPQWKTKLDNYLKHHRVLGLDLGPRSEMIRVKLDPGTPRWQVQNPDRRKFVAYAAQYYALDTADFLVTLRELVDNGYIPYQRAIDGLPLDAVISDAGVQTELIPTRYLEGNRQSPKAPEEIFETMNAKQRQKVLPDTCCSCVAKLHQTAAGQKASVDFRNEAQLPAYWVDVQTGAPLTEGWGNGHYAYIRVVQDNGIIVAVTGKGDIPMGSYVPWINAMSSIAMLMWSDALEGGTPLPDDAEPPDLQLPPGVSGVIPPGAVISPVMPDSPAPPSSQLVDN